MGLLGALLSATCQITAPSKYWIQFTDKNGSPYSIGQPSEFLSQRAIDRRQRFGIPIQTADLPVNPHYIDQVLSTGTVVLIHRSRWFNGITIHAEDSLALDSLNHLPCVKTVEPVKRLYAAAERSERKERIQTQQGTATGDAYGQAKGQVLQMQLDFLHNAGFKGSGLHIAVIDAGFRGVDTLEAFQSLMTSGRMLGTHDFVDGDQAVFAHSTHGTMVLSTMAANWPDKMIGTAPEASYWLLRSEEDRFETLLEEDNWIAAAEFADSAGVDIINTSLGYNTFDDPSQDHSYEQLDGKTLRMSIAQNLAAFRGILMVTSLGNEGTSRWKKLTVPADADSVLAVGGVTPNGSFSRLASIGPTYDERIKPNVAAQSELVAVASTGNVLLTAAGTSFASGLVAGGAACLWQAFPQYRNMDVFDAIEQSGHRASRPDNEVGHGIPNFFRAYDDLSNRNLVVVEDFIRVYPNPATEQVTIAFFSVSEQRVEVQVNDLTGRTVYFDQFAALEGRNLFDLEWEGLAPGIYTVVLITNDGILEETVIRQTP